MLAFVVPRLAPAPLSAVARIELFLAVWLVVRAVVWTVAVVASHHNPPLDLAEWLSWGGTWEWGYPKHPPVPAWLADLAARLSPGDVWGVYLLGYAASSLTMLAAYRLGREYLSPPLALVAALSLDGLKYLTNNPAEYGNNVLLNLAWAWLVVCSHRALATGRTRWWLAVGGVTGLGVLCKYTIGLAVLAVLAFVLFDRRHRAIFRTPGPYLAAAVAAVIVLPHALWLVKNDFITIRYAERRTAEARGALAHVSQPAQFLGTQAAMLAPVAFVLWPLLRRREANPPVEAKPVSPSFLHFTVIGPFAALIGLSVLTGCQLRELWGSPLWTPFGVWALATFRGPATPAAVRAALRRWAAVAAVMLAFVVGRQYANPYLYGVGGRTTFPGRELTAEVNRRWAAAYGGAPPVVAGEGWRAGLVCCYSVHRPVLYSRGTMDYLDLADCPWTGDADLNARGGVILWNAAREGDDATAGLRERFPRVAAQPAIVLPFATAANVPPTRVGVAFVPPAQGLAAR
jgi:hypothetical protein